MYIIVFIIFSEECFRFFFDLYFIFYNLLPFTSEFCWITTHNLYPMLL